MFGDVRARADGEPNRRGMTKARTLPVQKPAPFQ